MPEGVAIQRSEVRETNILGPGHGWPSETRMSGHSVFHPCQNLLWIERNIILGIGSDVARVAPNDPVSMFNYQSWINQKRLSDTQGLVVGPFPSSTLGRSLQPQSLFSRVNSWDEDHTLEPNGKNTTTTSVSRRPSSPEMEERV